MKAKTTLLSLFATLSVLAMTGCTENIRAKRYGGSMTISLPKGTKLVNATWKGADLWYSYRPSREGEVPEKVTFQESSNYGIMEGKVIFQEQ